MKKTMQWYEVSRDQAAIRTLTTRVKASSPEQAMNTALNHDPDEIYEWEETDCQIVEELSITAILTSDENISE